MTLSLPFSSVASVICISRFAGHGSTYLAVSLFSRFKDSPFQETDDTVICLQQCGFKNPHMCTYPFSRSFRGLGLQA